jgi:hypothetical protein
VFPFETCAIRIGREGVTLVERQNEKVRGRQMVEQIAQQLAF